jgi:hypothetical protein
MACAVLDLAPDVLPKTSVVAPSAGVSGSSVPWNNKVLITILGMMIGTGGVATPALVNRVAVSSQFHITVCEGKKGNGALRAALLPQEQIAGLQRYLSMNVTDLARVLRVARPTVYAWIRGTEPHGLNLERISQLYRVSRVWRAMSGVPIGKYVNAQSPGGQSVLELLSQEKINESKVSELFAEIKTALDNEPHRRTISETARARGLRAVKTRDAKKWSSEDDLNL